MANKLTNTHDSPLGPLEPIVRFTVTEKAMRQASASPQCFYCQQPIGAEHTHKCVLIQKRVKVRMVVEYEVAVPAHWNGSQIEYHRNDCSWCASNAIGELDRLFGNDEGPCMCNFARFEYMGSDSEPFLDEGY